MVGFLDGIGVAIVLLAAVLHDMLPEQNVVEFGDFPKVLLDELLDVFEDLALEEVVVVVRDVLLLEHVIQVGDELLGDLLDVLLLVVVAVSLEALIFSHELRLLRLKWELGRVRQPRIRIRSLLRQ